jgi:hypothetical protein
VAFHRDATDKAITIARDFGVRGRVLVPPQDLGPKGELNDWLVGPDGRDPKRLKETLAGAMAQSPSPWVPSIECLKDVLLWDRHEQLEGLLAELAPMPPVSRETILSCCTERPGSRSVRCLRLRAILKWRLQREVSKTARTSSVAVRR